MAAPRDTQGPDGPDPTATGRGAAVSSYTTVLRRAAVREETFRAYWRDVHGPLCSRVPGLGWYVQHHFARLRDAHLAPWRDDVGPLAGYVLDGAVEIGWADAAAQQVFTDASDVLFSDEQNVFEETAAYPLPTGTTTLLDREPDPAPNGADRFDRVHLHLGPAAGRRDEAVEVLRAGLPAVVDAPGLVTLRLHALDPHDNSTPNPPAPGVEHTVADARVAVVVLELAFTDPLARRRAYADGPLVELGAALVGALGHVTAFGVTGVHTFVRGGRLTDAGLRGSRAAELITGLAALNQVGDEVRHLMRTGTLPDA